MKARSACFVFSFTDDWYVHGWQIEDWSFGLTRRDRSPKPAFAAIKQIFEKAPQVAVGVKLPRISVVICSYNGASTVESCLRSMEKIRYPDFEVIFVDDGSTDHTQEILKNFPWVREHQAEKHGPELCPQRRHECRHRRDRRLHRQRLRSRRRLALFPCPRSGSQRPYRHGRPQPHSRRRKLGRRLRGPFARRSDSRHGR